MAVDDEGMAVPLAASVKMGMVELETFMGMLEFIRIVGWPHSGRDKDRHGCEERKQPERCGEADPGT